uniref:Vacuolar protein 14 C-terminal Fig4-binding domain-containing protein n=1 Tax=Vannella robusta TaxID=1487602 RepID=A0A7S4IQF6_9EUKA
MRENLKDLLNSEHKTLFIRLYKSWCHNPASTFSLCLIAEAYDHAYELVCKFAELEITVGFLVEIDKLVQLIESPIFTGLRMQLLEPTKYPSLYKCLYGLLMLLPQSDAFETLKNRLNSVATLGQVYLLVQGAKEDVCSVQSKSAINFTELAQHFLTVQKAHQSQNRHKVLSETPR